MPLHRINHDLRRFFWSRPVLYRPLGMLRGKGDVFRFDFDLMVEGYPRSANTYMANLLRVTQPRFRVKNRAHIPCHAIAAAEAGIPVLMLLRAPLDCVSSYAILKEEPATIHLRYYLAYHEVLRTKTKGMLLVDFDTAINSSLGVLSAFDETFGLGFDYNFDFATKQAEALALIDREGTRPDGTVDYRFLNRPTEERNAWKQEVVAELMSPANAVRLARANEVYRELRQRALVVDSTPAPVALAR